MLTIRRQIDGNRGVGNDSGVLTSIERDLAQIAPGRRLIFIDESYPAALGGTVRVNFADAMRKLRDIRAVRIYFPEMVSDSGIRNEYSRAALIANDRHAVITRRAGNHLGGATRQIQRGKIPISRIV